jgi:predicted lipoprotein with Yx(FWY)xxD motif
MKPIQRLVSLAVTAVLLLAAGSALAAAAEPSLKISSKDAVGSFLTDAKGMTLYTFTKDSGGKSACAGPCVEKWPVFYREPLVTPEGVIPVEFATITRADGKKQTTYKGRPLYYFAADMGAGDTKGDQVNEVWFVARP